MGNPKLSSIVLPVKNTSTGVITNQTYDLALLESTQVTVPNTVTNFKDVMKSVADQLISITNNGDCLKGEVIWTDHGYYTYLFTRYASTTCVCIIFGASIIRVCSRGGNTYTYTEYTGTSM